jgi:hypothetical protein
LFYSSIIGNIFALGVHTIQIYPHLIHQVAIVLINDTLRLEIERVMLRGAYSMARANLKKSKYMLLNFYYHSIKVHTQEA